MAGRKNTAEQPEKTKKTRKQYPSHEERIAAADKKIEHLKELIAERSDLVAKTEKILSERRIALAKSEEALAKTEEKKERLISVMTRAASGKPTKLTPEERAEKRKADLAKAREAKKAEKAKRDALMNALNEKGMSIDELLQQLNQK